MTPGMTEPTCVLAADNHLGEGPIWSATEQMLWWINCEKPAEILRWSPTTGQLDRWAMPRRIGGFVHQTNGDLLVALADGVYDFAPSTGETRLRARSPLPPHIMLHECHCDRQGRFWTGAYDHHYPADRSAAGAFFFRLDGDRLVPEIDGISVSNGLAFSPDGTTMYAAGAPGRKVEAFDIDAATGSVFNRRTFLTLEAGHGFIDGATVDAQGGYWLALVGIGALRRYWPDGTLDREIALPCSNPTKPAFGGADLGTLYVTSTRMMINPTAPGNVANGGLFALRPGETGVTEALFSG